MTSNLISIQEGMSFSHPCLSCGACCATLRVSFYWREANPEDQSKPVPEEYVEFGDYKYSVMKGTNQKNPRCLALEGELGKKTSCKIYENRPSPCRDFIASYQNGQHEPKCDEVRLKIGLRPLTPSDWL